jgi:hypothetical protein
MSLLMALISMTTCPQPPQTGLMAHVKTACPVEDHLIRVSPVQEVLEKGIDNKDQIGQEESTNQME